MLLNGAISTRNARIFETKLEELKLKYSQAGLDEHQMQQVIIEANNDNNNIQPKSKKNYFNQTIFIILILSASIYYSHVKLAQVSCIIKNNYLTMEITRPVSDCEFCQGVTEFLILNNVTRNEFMHYAYTSHPILVRNAVDNWPALQNFNFNFFKSLYLENKAALDTVEEECQFFPFKTDFLSLKDVFQMPEKRANFSEARPWYIGWSNCNFDISTALRKHYSRPSFLPPDSESSAIDWIFMGYSGPGASMHLDYVQRPSWQAQISGSKTWLLQPPPECEKMCAAMNVTTYKGDIILVNTNLWYHTTYINNEDISITIGSEYD